MKKTRIVGFQSGHDIAYCILENGVPVIHEEQERISRVKMETGDGLKFFFSRTEPPDDVNYFAFGNPNFRAGKWIRRCRDKESDDKMNRILTKNHGEFHEFSHHLSHGSNAFYTSNFDRALIICIDGGGYETTGNDFVTSFTISEGVGNKITRIKTFPKTEINLGGLWTHATRNIFGLSTWYPKGSQEGTVMAMATLGEPKYLDIFYRERKLKAIANTSEQEKFNVAATLQLFTEKTFFDTISKYITDSDHENICFSGGVSLNSVMLGKIKKRFPQIKGVFCDPVPYDAGLALGSARYLWHHVLGNPRIKNNIKNMSPYLGKIYTKKDVEQACDLFSSQIRIKKTTDIDVLNKINDQKIVSVFGGGSESGRRALGNRSILADPRNPDMKKMINDKVKHREWFRPFAPSILEESVDDWFEEHYDSPYMSFVLRFKEEVRDKVPAVVHFDGTGRLQTVKKDLSPWFHNFITQWEKISGVPILLNTSFNDSEPIVETPKDAIKCFLGTNIDYLYFFDFGLLVTKI